MTFVAVADLVDGASIIVSGHGAAKRNIKMIG